MKALQQGIGDMEPLDVEIVSTPLGAPAVELHRAARAIAKKRGIDYLAHLSDPRGRLGCSDRYRITTHVS